MTKNIHFEYCFDQSRVKLLLNKEVVTVSIVSRNSRHNYFDQSRDKLLLNVAESSYTQFSQP